MIWRGQYLPTVRNDRKQGEEIGVETEQLGKDHSSGIQEFVRREILLWYLAKDTKERELECDAC